MVPTLVNTNAVKPQIHIADPSGIETYDFGFRTVKDSACLWSTRPLSSTGSNSVSYSELATVGDQALAKIHLFLKYCYQLLESNTLQQFVCSMRVMSDVHLSFE